MIMRKQITITDYDGFTYDMAMRIKYQWDYMFDMEDQNSIDEELYDDFSKIFGDSMKHSVFCNFLLFLLFPLRFKQI